MIDIQPQHIALDRLFYGRLFRVPSYQRAYSWHQEQRADLFDDIRRTWAAGPNRTHFMATVVGLRRETKTIVTREHQVTEIVDGQQRITTLVLLLKAIAKKLDRSEADAKRLGQELDEILVKPDKASLLLLQTNHDTSHYFADYLRKGTHPNPESAQTLADRELLSAMKECEDFVTSWQKDGNLLEDLASLLRNKLTFVFHEIADEAIVYTVFEVLNSRGLDVSWFDRCKSMLMAIIFETASGNREEIINEVHQLWSDIYRCVGLRLGLSTESLRFAATLHSPDRPNRPLSEEAAAQLLREQSKGGPRDVLDTVKWLKAVTEAVDKLLANRRLNAVTRIAQARMVATAVHLRPDFTNEARAKILRRWENVSFRTYGMLENDARTAVGDYVRLAWSIVKKKPSESAVLKKLAEIGAEFAIDDAVDNLRNTDCYTDWQEELRYFLYRYEEHLAKEAGQKFNSEQWNRIWADSATSSIEHILPQSDGSPERVNRLGNLILLPPGLNSKLGNKSPRQKAQAYGNTGLLMAQEVVGSLSEWNVRAIKKREEDLLEWASREWAD